MHLYNAHILKNYSSTGTEFAKYFKINSFLLPNALADLGLCLLMTIFPVLFAEKVFLSLYVIIFSLSIVYFTDSINRKENLSIIAPLFIYNLFLFFGFYNFMLSIPIFLFTFGYWFRNHKRTLISTLVFGNLLAFTLYLSHICSWALFILGVIFISLITEKIRGLMKAALWIIPTVALSLIVFSVTGQEILRNNVIYSPLTKRLSMLLVPVFLRYYSGIEVIFALSFIVFLVVYILCCRARVEGLTDQQEALLLFAGLLIVVYFLCPYWYGAAGYINVRISFFIFLLLVPLISIRPGTVLRYACVIYVPIFTIAHVFHIEKMSLLYNNGINEFTSGIGCVKPNSVFLSMVKDRHGSSRWIAPYSHAYYYYELATNSINPYHQDGNIPVGELEAIEKLSLVQLREEYRYLRSVRFSEPLAGQQAGIKGYDYILIWDKIIQPVELQDFNLVHKTDHLLLYENHSRH